jgi:O-6-methylguanine DNA methyltransferase
MMKTFKDRVYRTLRGQVPAGFVVTYGQLAAMCGRPHAARAVGNILHNNPFAPKVPCHRVVSIAGKLARNFGARGKLSTQRERLLGENIPFIDDETVDLQKCQKKWSVY